MCEERVVLIDTLCLKLGLLTLEKLARDRNSSCCDFAALATLFNLSIHATKIARFSCTVRVQAECAQVDRKVHQARKNKNHFHISKSTASHAPGNAVTDSSFKQGVLQI